MMLYVLEAEDGKNQKLQSEQMNLSGLEFINGVTH